MNNNECNNCGAVLDCEQKKCRYCGTNNPTYNPTKVVKETPLFYNTVQNNTNKSQQPVKKSNFSVLIFILLLVFFWPAAIIYLVVSTTKK